MTFPGIPGLYYGDEIGMVDMPGLGARGCMIWDEDRWERSLHAFYRDVIRLRARSSAMRRGGFQLLMTEEDTIAYQREAEEERLLVVAHRSERPLQAKSLPVSHGGVIDGTRFVDPMSGIELETSGGELVIPRLDQGAMILMEVREG
jgi:alpha-glucosidase